MPETEPWTHGVVIKLDRIVTGVSSKRTQQCGAMVVQNPFFAPERDTNTAELDVKISLLKCLIPRGIAPFRVTDEAIRLFCLIAQLSGMSLTWMNHRIPCE